MIHQNEMLNLKRAAAYIRRIAGRPVSTATIKAWVNVGVTTGEGQLRLKAENVTRGVYLFRTEWLHEFFAARANASRPPTELDPRSAQTNDNRVADAMSEIELYAKKATA